MSSPDGVDSVSGSEDSVSGSRDSISQWQVLDLSGCEWGEDAEFPGEEPPIYSSDREYARDSTVPTSSMARHQEDFGGPSSREPLPKFAGKPGEEYRVFRSDFKRWLTLNSRGKLSAMAAFQTLKVSFVRN